MKKTAVLLGATGLTGSHLLELLIDDNRYDKIKLFSRKKIDIKSSKIEQYIGNIIELKTFKEEFTGDDIFCCIGTTAKKTPDKNIYKSIDFGIPAAAAKLAKENNISKFIVVSAIGANVKSRIFYNRIKGEMEQAVLNQNVEQTYILQPSFIFGKRNENRSMEKIAAKIFNKISPILVGNLKKYKPIQAKIIAEAMLKLANSNEKTQIITSDKIKEITLTIN